MCRTVSVLSKHTPGGAKGLRPRVCNSAPDSQKKSAHVRDTDTLGTGQVYGILWVILATFL